MSPHSFLLSVIFSLEQCRMKSRHHHRASSAGGTHLTLEGLDTLIDTNKPHLEYALADRPGTSYFEVFTALALRHFADSKIDWTIMEAGLGGVSDATNVFKAHQVRLCPREPFFYLWELHNLHTFSHRGGAIHSVSRHHRKLSACRCGPQSSQR